MTISEPKLLTLNDSIELTHRTQRRSRKDKNKKPLPNYAIIDIKTTGYSEKDEIVEISIVLLDHDGQHSNWRISNSYSTLVMPVLQSTQINNEASHKIDFGLLKGAKAPTFKEIAPFVSSLLNGRKLVGYNINEFDSKILQKAFNRTGFKKVIINSDVVKVKWIDVFDLMNSLNLPNVKTTKNLSTVANYYGIVNQHPNVALSDTLSVAGIFMRMMENDDIQRKVLYHKEVFVDTIKNEIKNNSDWKPRYILPQRLPSTVGLEELSVYLTHIPYRVVEEIRIPRTQPQPQPSVPNPISNPVTQLSNSVDSKSPSGIDHIPSSSSGQEFYAILAILAIVTGISSLIFFSSVLVPVLSVFICGAVVGSSKNAVSRISGYIGTFLSVLSILIHHL